MKGALSALSLSLPLLLAGHCANAGISAGYVPPLGKQGVNESYNFGTLPRYQRLSALGLNSHSYNLYWRYFETGNVASFPPPPPSGTLPTCPWGYQLIPASESEFSDKHYKRYRCFNNDAILNWDAALANDAQAGLQSVAVLWAAPSIYQYADCKGIDFGDHVEKGGCVPRDDAMDDWQDYVTFLASRYSTNNPSNQGKIHQFIIWNEVASGYWFDYSPVVPVSSAPITTTQIDAWIDKYVDMLDRAHAAIAANTQGILMEVSLDNVWEQPPFDGRQHLGSKTILDGLWQRRGTQYDWSVAIHPYGDPINETAGQINFQATARVSAYQLAKLRALNVAAPAAAAQMKIAATEQGWQQYLGRDVQARNICEAHEISSRHPFLLGQYHSTFQDVGGDSPQSWGLVPVSAGWDLANADGIVTFEAYRSTGYNGWQKSDSHYCCTAHKLGCQTPSPHAMASAYASSVLWSEAALIDGDPNTSYSSAYSPSATNVNNYQIAAWVSPSRPDGLFTASVRMQARMLGTQPLGFPAEYMLFVGDPVQGWVSMGTFKDQPDSTGRVTVALPRLVRATGVLMFPLVLGVDNAGNHFFQLNEIALHPGGANGAYLPIPLQNPTALDSSNPALPNLVDGNTTTYYESPADATANNSAGNFVAAWSALPVGSQNVNGIRLKAYLGSSGPVNFPLRYMVSVGNPTNSAWEYLGEFSAQPDSNGDVIIPFDLPRMTGAVLIHPSLLRQVGIGDYRFRLAEIELLP